MSNNSHTEWVQPLVDWFQHAKRQMPWRDNPTPYYVMVSEFMLQQTQVATVIDYFQRFVSRFPTLQSLATAPEQDVLKQWEGLGYYSRARHLQQCAQLICQYGSFPDTPEKLTCLPGIGDYTAAAITSIAFGKPYPVVDGNVLRIRTRMTEDPSIITDKATQRKIQNDLTSVIEQCPSPSDFNQAMMELGALICHPTNPLCTECPVAPWCLAQAHGTQLDYPVKKPRAVIPHYHVAVGIIFDNGKFLILRRTEEQMLGGLWEFPGGKLEPGETGKQACLREIKEETGLDVTVKKRLATINHTYSHFKITMEAFACYPTASTEIIATDRPYAWITYAEIPNYPFPKANHKIFDKLENL